MPSLPLLPNLPAVTAKPASSLRLARRGRHRRAWLFLGAPAECTTAIAELGAPALAIWRAQGPGATLPPRSVNGLPLLVDGQTATVHAASPGGSAGMFEHLTQAGRLVRAALALSPQEVVLWGSNDTAREALWSAWVAAQHELPALRKQPASVRARPPVAVPIGLAAAARQRCEAMERGAALARWLTALPGNHLTPALYRKRVQALARQQGWTVTVHDERALRRAGAGAFLAVAQGNRAGDACLLRVVYQPARSGLRRRALPAPVALVGKGVCFDTGGVNLKQHRGMLDMHTDMAGSAVALGTLLALTELQHGEPVEAWLALAENHLDAGAYKPQDVVRASNGTTIQIIHTDAEGRMLLADALAMAARTRPRALLDFATLTGACINALTDRYAGLFTNRPAQRDRLESVGRRSGERVWTMPLDEDFDAELESRVADVLQCPVEGKGDHIYAARFLQRFVGTGLPWIHLDLAAATRHGGLAHIATDITGFGVRYATTLLQDADILRSLAADDSALP